MLNENSTRHTSCSRTVNYRFVDYFVVHLWRAECLLQRTTLITVIHYTCSHAVSTLYTCNCLQCASLKGCLFNYSRSDNEALRVLLSALQRQTRVMLCIAASSPAHLEMKSTCTGLHSCAWNKWVLHLIWIHVNMHKKARERFNWLTGWSGKRPRRCVFESLDTLRLWGLRIRSVQS